MSFIPQQVYDKLVTGTTLSNSELVAGVVWLKDLSEKMNKMGPVFKLAARELNDKYLIALGYAENRGLKIPIDRIGDESVPKTSLTWEDILTQRHIPKLGWTIYSFSQFAKQVGYPYFEWSGWIYDTATNERTEYKATDIS